MMKELRSVFLQDAPHLRKTYPELFIWQEPFFHSAEYLQWEKHALEATQSGSTYHINSTLEELQPAIADAIRSQRSEQRAQLDRLLSGQSVLSVSLDSVIKQAGELNYKQDGHGTVLHNLQHQIVNYQVALQKLALGFSKSCNEIFNNPSDTASEPPPLPLPTPPPPAPLPLSAIPVQQLPTTTSIDLRAPVLATPTTTTPTAAAPQPKADILARGLKNVRVVWQEYTVGLHGRPPISTIYDNGVKPKFPSQNEARFWNDRKVIIEAVQMIHKDYHRSIEDSVAVLERIRQKQNSMSLKQLARFLRNKENLKSAIACV